ncbi:GNAT superfamily N-acetyltransferase [Actinoplanes octamycinicus]|uniref:GNAT superfamily N-acetyltransferase n=1 Tax=Actinoplanes octamycinicus TaxID=135948 RepID=A0A7W7M4L4_9ACTN|nr:GNAT family N-acetyltransferase [Actinoplanes octamycinicus]MBB4736785.1 GNAT superfamily N-acetyltransferase [Actinoplanes octamycinicus]GIE60552.1 GNAT family acetyltransferase [Actinoplanes octamycinicus]
MEFRIAARDDVPAVLALLADDDLSRERGFGEVPAEIGPGIWAAFEAIEADPHNELIVAVQDGEVVGTCQLTYLPGLSRGGAWRMQVEAVRIHAGRRGRGLGAEMMRWTIERARERGCRMVQLTSDKKRVDAHRFYERLGFARSHEGMKLTLAPEGGTTRA